MSNNLTEKFYVYALLNPLKDNQPFYIGKGQGLRYRHHLSKAVYNKNKSHKSNTIKKIINAGYEVGVKILFRTNNESEAFNKEKYFIKKYGRKDLGEGILTNNTNGGEGPSGEDNPMFGRKHTEDTVKKISKILREKIKSGEYVPHKHTEEWKKKLRNDNAGGKATAKEVYQIDTYGNVVDKWPSINQAAKKLNVSKANISTAIKKEFWVCKNFYWRYTDSSDVVDEKLITIDKCNTQRMKPRQHKGIIQIAPNGDIVKEWHSGLDIKRELGFDNTIISNIVRGKRQNPIYKGFYWKYS